MNAFQKPAQRTDRLIWIVIAAIGMAILAASVIGSLRIEWESFLKPAGACLLLGAAGWFYGAVRKDACAAAALTSTAQIAAFSAVGAPLSYLAARAGFPLQDALFAALDHRLGIDWPGYVSIVTSNVWLRRLFLIAYLSFTVQVIATVLVLGFAGHFQRLSIFVLAFLLTTLVTIGISAFVPAAGPWLFYHAQPDLAHGAIPISSTSWPVFLGLRDGTFNTMSALNSEGIITFPSLHAALGVLFAIALWRVRGLRTIALILNIAMILATPFAGSHYVVDVIAGIAIALGCWIAASWSLRSRSAASTARFSPAADSPSIIPDLSDGGPAGSPVRDPLRADARADVTHEH